jgi:hypothetical protein
LREVGRSLAHDELQRHPNRWEIHQG